MSNQRYLVAARKYRPAVFSELVAQDHVADTLKNAIRLDRLAHAYLFSGPRGVGKTTAARILAKAINCTTPLDERDDGAEPCRTCDSCQAFEAGRSLNIFEIDAASNNKVDDIRELRETVRIPPQGARKKVYIIDEVHMLSNAAFNALLKTLEEPPPHVLFIFATTEPHKVLPTILSRCQRFDFRRIPVPDIVERLREICEAEAITADEASLMLLARKGDGALRDALSAFDQAVSLCGTELEYAELTQALGVVDLDLSFEVMQHVAGRDSAGMLRLVERVVRSGYDLQEFLVGLAEHLRNLLVAHTMKETSLIEATEAMRQRYAETSEPFTEADLLRLLMIVAEAEETIKGSTQPRLKLEVALLKMASLSHAVDLRQALQKLDRLEEMARQGELPTASPSTSNDGAPSSSSPTPPSTPPEKPRSASDEKAPASEETAPPQEEPEAAEDDEPAPEVQESTVSDEEDPGPFTPPSPSPEPSSEEEPSSTADEPSAPPDYPSLFGQPALKKKRSRPDSSEQDDTSNANLSSAERPQADAGGTAVATAPAEPQLEALGTTWPRYVQTVKQERIHVGTLLQHTTPVEANTDTLVLAVPDDFHKRLLSNQHKFLLKHLNALAECSMARLEFTIQTDTELQASQPKPETDDPYAILKKKRQENPVVAAIFEQFGGELVW